MLVIHCLFYKKLKLLYKTFKNLFFGCLCKTYNVYRASAKLRVIRPII